MTTFTINRIGEDETIEQDVVIADDFKLRKGFLLFTNSHEFVKGYSAENIVSFETE